MEMLLRRDGFREILPGMRCEEAGAEAGSRIVEVLLRRDGFREILSGVRGKEAGAGWLDLLLRHGEQGKVLPELRREKAGGRAALSLR